MVKERNIVTSIILSFVTCGIYMIYWFVCLANDTKEVTKNEKLPSGGKAVLFSLLTCGIYTYYWFYQVGKSLSQKRVDDGKSANDNAVLYLILSLFGLGIVNYCLIQSELNEYANKEA